MQSARNAKPTKPAKLTPTTFLREVARRVALAETGVAGDPEGDALETIASIAKLLGLTGLAATSKDAIVEAVGALFDGGATPRDEDITLTARRYGLTPREVTMCRAKGVDLAKYAARRAAKAGRK